MVDIAKEELEKLFEMPKIIYSIDERRQPDVYQPWHSRQEALSLLLSLRGDKLPVPCHLAKQVSILICNSELVGVQVMTKYTQNVKMYSVVENVTHFAWKMVILSPPVTFGTPKFSVVDDLYELTDMNGLLNKDDNNQQYSVEYRRPVLFYGPLGTVGHKGNVVINPPQIVQG